MELQKIINELNEDAYKNQFRGIDPYDFANSKIKLPNFLLSKVSFINKILPFSIRKFIGIRESDNTKSNALFLYAMVINNNKNDEEKIEYLKNWLIKNRSNEFEEYTLGFAFEMALSRYSSGPGKTSLFITLIGVCAFIELYKRTKDPVVLEQINSFKSLLDNKWLKIETEDTLFISYLPDHEDVVYNISAVTGKFYALYYELFPLEVDKVKILKILGYLRSVQNADGSWAYSENAPYVDNFHTCFILEAIYYMHQVVSAEWSIKMFDLALKDYEENCFDGAQPLHFHKNRKPKDVRSNIIKTEIRDIANAIILFSLLGNISKAQEVIGYSFKKYYDYSGKYFYFFHNWLYMSKLKFVRWQAWMSLAFSVYLNKSK